MVWTQEYFSVVCLVWSLGESSLQKDCCWWLSDSYVNQRCWRCWLNETFQSTAKTIVLETRPFWMWISIDCSSLQTSAVNVWPNLVCCKPQHSSLAVSWWISTHLCYWTWVITFSSSLDSEDDHVAKVSVTSNSLSEDYSHPDDHTT